METNSTAPEKAVHGIIGWPLGHTMSPVLHNWAFESMGIPAVYKAYPLPPEDLEFFMAHVREAPLAGLSVTIPHKLAVKPYLDGFSDGVLAVGAVNTVYWDGKRLMGENTDLFGFVSPLRKLPVRVESALVFGAGGAARAVVAGLLQLGVPDIIITNRNADKAMELANEFHVSAADWDERHRIDAELLVNATPLGMSGDGVGLSPLPEGMRLSSRQIAYDIVYNPLRTVFLEQAAARGCHVIDGLDMFVHQAVEQFRLWTGKTFDIDAARRLLAARLSA
ncbi:shikimate dehydrogenase [Desulfobaculum xiamenense]|uniref:Shikimate dehydrogenase (NADP(+)) n=1 Tax=Desulfobaculum xiamenense TaxID=995050 RepID=A0A846QLR7_9BACT|nr:shikimate dehydrogenase [Desulfobaculum xiamenense]NJB67970.1 shikimate dehydrogenase [Desulfobaculum xiamenense]